MVGANCESLWTQRNAIWHRYRYCFQTEKAQRAFGNAGCVHRDQASARNAMSPADSALVAQLVGEERRLNCN